MFSFHDGDQKQSYEQIDSGSNVDYLGAKFKDVLFVLEVLVLLDPSLSLSSLPGTHTHTHTQTHRIVIFVKVLL